MPFKAPRKAVRALFQGALPTCPATIKALYGPLKGDRTGWGL